MQEIRALAERNAFGPPVAARGKVAQVDIKPEYIEHLLSYVDLKALAPLKIVVNAGNGGAGPIVDLLEPHLPFRFVKVFHEPDGSFPNGVPNPMIEENRAVTIERLRAERADLGIAWDGDYDRCFFFDERGQFIEGYYIVGLLAETFLAKSPGERIVHDPRLTWNTLDIVEPRGGEAVQSKSGHAFIKQRMREVDAVYGGEMSAHHYFREFSYADSGMIPWLLITEIMSQAQGARCRSSSASACARSPRAARSTARSRMPPAVIARVEADVRAGRARRRPHRRIERRVRAVALQPALVEHRAAAAPQRREPRRRRR